VNDDLIRKATEIIRRARLEAPRSRGMEDDVSPAIARALDEAGMLRDPAFSTDEFSSSESAGRVLSELRGIATDGVATASIRRMAELTGLGRSTVNRAFSRLVAADLIAPVRLGTGDGFPTSWRLAESGPDARSE